MRLNVLLISIFIVCAQTAYSQWTVEVTVSGFTSAPDCMWTTSQPTFNANALGHSSSGSNALHYSFTMPSGDFDGTITANGTQSCNCVRGDGVTDPDCTPATGFGSGTLPVHHTTAMGEDCVGGSQSFSGTNFSLSISYTVYKKMDKPVVTPPSGTCGGDFTITSPSDASSYAWQVNDASLSPGLWQYLSKNTKTITVSASDLNLTGFTGTRRVLRVTSNLCTNRQSDVSDAFDILLPPPSFVDIDWGSITCPGGEDVTLTLKSVTSSPGVSSFVVTLRLKDEITGVYGNIFQRSYAKTAFPKTLNNSLVPAPNPVLSIKEGNYQIEVANATNASKLGACSVTYNSPITDPPDIVPNVSPTLYNGFGLKCNGDNSGQLTANPTGGNPGVYTYAWSNSATTQTISNLSAGTYSVTVFDSKGCSKGASKTLTPPNPLTGSVAIDKIPSCDESNDGQLSVTVPVGAGVAPYTYSWTSGSSTNVAPNLTKGDYTVTVTDNNHCTAPIIKTLTAPPPIVVTLGTTPPTCPGVPDGGKIEVTDVQNEFGPVTYLWNTNDITPQLINVPAGPYSVTVSSVHGTKTCIGTASGNVVDPDAWTATVSPLPQYNGAAISCPDATDGRLDVVLKNDLGQTVSGEFYTWSNGDSGPAKTFIDGLGEGSYDVSVKYNGICQATTTYALLAPKPLVIDIIPDTDYHGQVLSCSNESDGAITATASFGTGLSSSFSYLWNTGATTRSISGLPAGTYNITVKDVNQCVGTGEYTIVDPDPVTASIPTFSNYTTFGVSCNGKTDGFLTAAGAGGTTVYSYVWSSGQNTANITNLAPGNYTVDVSDNNGCSSSASYTITEPDVLEVQVAQMKDVACFSGSDGYVRLAAAGGAPQYEYSIDNTNWQFEEDFNNLPIGTYTLTLRDANGCKDDIMQQLVQPDVLHIDFANIEPAYCADPRGKATGVVTGGAGAYQYEWRNSDSDILSTTAQLSDVPAGIYDLFVKDAHDCPVTDQVPITSTDGAKTTYTSVDAKCFDSSDGTADLEITEGDGPFAIKWPDNKTTLERIDLKKGTYNVLITDGHDCTVVQTVIVHAPDAIQLKVKDQVIPTCNTFCDGSMTLEASGGVGGYIYTWNGLSGGHQNNLCAAVYPVVVKDANACVLNSNAELKQPDAITVALVKEMLATCTDGCDGSLQVSAAGGNGTYGYVWAAGATASTIANICPASYDVTVTDVKGCTGTETFTLHNTPRPPFDLGGGVTLCVGQKYTLDAGSQWTSVKWGSSTGVSSTEQAIEVSADGTYWADVISAQGCLAQDTFLLQTSRDLLHAEFFMASSASVGDTIVMVEVSWPLPDAVEWTFPAGMNKIYDEDGIVFGQYNAAGSYDVLLTAHLAECVDVMTKTVMILEEVDDAGNGRLGYESFVKTFVLHPNPNDGKFDLSIEFQSESHVVISVWNAVDLKMVGKLVDDGKSAYEEQLDLRPLPPGSYLLRLDHDRGKEYIRFIVY